MRLLVLLLCVAFASAVEHRAMTNLTDPKNESHVVGNVTFVQIYDGDVTITGIVTGLTPGDHGFHVHEKGDVSASCNDTGGHYNPFKKSHGGPKDDMRHVGDLGNIVADAHGVASINMTDSVIKLTGEHSIVGLSVVVHADKDDLGKGTFADSMTTGHAGARLACGKITNYTTQQSGTNHVTSESTTGVQQRSTNERTTESKTNSEPSGSAPLYVSWSLIVLLWAALNLY